MKELTSNNEIKLVKVSNVLDIKKSPNQVSKLKRENPEMLLKILVSFIMKFQSYLNIESKMNDDQVVFCADELINEYWGYKLEDFQLFFKRASIGKYGKIYKRLAPITIFEMIEIYDNEKESELIRQHQIEKSVKTTLNENKVPQIILDKIDELKNKSGFDYTDPEYLKIKSDIYKENLKGNKKDE